MVPEPRPAPARQRSPSTLLRALRSPACVLALLACAATAHAQLLYVCTTKSGHRLTGDMPPPECKDREIRVLNPDGSLKRIIEAPLSDAEKEEKRRHDQEQDRKEEEAKKQQNYERSLVETYGSVSEIEAARKRDVDGQKLLIARADDRLAQYQRELKKLNDEAEFYAKREMPRKLKEAFATNKVLTDQQVQTKARAEANIQRINEQYDEKVRTYEDIERRTREAQEARRRAESQSQSE